MRVVGEVESVAFFRKTVSMETIYALLTTNSLTKQHLVAFFRKPVSMETIYSN